MKEVANLKFNDAILAPEKKDESRIYCAFHINTFDYPSLHSHDDYWEFTVVTNGAVENRFNGKSYYCPANTLFYGTTEDIHSLHKVGVENPRYINIMIKTSKLYPLLDAISPNFKSALLKGNHFLKVSGQFVQDIETIIHCANVRASARVETNEISESAALLALQHIYFDFIKMPENKSSFMQAINELALDPSFLLFTVADLCEKLNYSRIHLNRLFKKDFGCTPHDYLIKTKLRYASSLLINSEMSISEIALKVGFSNPSQFNADFKKEFKTTPGSYRRNHTARTTASIEGEEIGAVS